MDRRPKMDQLAELVGFVGLAALFPGQYSTELIKMIGLVIFLPDSECTGQPGRRNFFIRAKRKRAVAGEVFRRERRGEQPALHLSGERIHM